MSTSKHRGVYLKREVNKYGKAYYYWIAQLCHEKKRYYRRCISEEHAKNEYDKMCMVHGLFENIEL